MVRVTVVNDSPELLDLIGEILEGDRHVTTLIDGSQEDLLHRIRWSQPELLMIDLGHGGDTRHGWEIVQQLRAFSDGGKLPVVLCSADIAGLSEIEHELSAAEGVVALSLPFEIDELVHITHRLISRREQTRCTQDRT